MNSTRTADFLTPRNHAHALFRDAVLDLVDHADYMRPLVNSGRLSTPATYPMPQAPDPSDLPLRTRPGAPLCDAPTDEGWLSDLIGSDWSLLALNCVSPDIQANGVSPRTVTLEAEDASLLAERYLGEMPRAIYLFRPDQHIAGRWIETERTALENCLEAALGGKV